MSNFRSHDLPFSAVWFQKRRDRKSLLPTQDSSVCSIWYHSAPPLMRNTRCSAAEPRTVSIPATSPVAVPFPVGERLVYQAKFGIFNVGTATMEVAGIDTVRGAAALH